MSGSSHPPSVLTVVQRTLESCELPRPLPLVVAVSGGPDSMALLHSLSLLQEKFPLQLLAVTLNHGLREAALGEVELVEQFCTRLGVPCETRDLGLSLGPNVQERARKARYDALWSIARTHFGTEAYLATAHHADDRAETVLLRLLRGTSVEGLSVLPAQSDRLLRPLIRARRSDIELHLARHQVPFCRDPSNQDPRFLRVRVRNELLPLMEELSPGVTEHLAHLAREAEMLEEPLGLNREQRAQLRKALRDPRVFVDLPLGNGLRLQREQDGFSSK